MRVYAVRGMGLEGMGYAREMDGWTYSKQTLMHEPEPTSHPKHTSHPTTSYHLKPANPPLRKQPINRPEELHVVSPDLTSPTLLPGNMRRYFSFPNPQSAIRNLQPLPHPVRRLGSWPAAFGLFPFFFCAVRGLGGGARLHTTILSCPVPSDIRTVESYVGVSFYMCCSAADPGWTGVGELYLALATR